MAVASRADETASKKEKGKRLMALTNMKRKEGVPVSQKMLSVVLSITLAFGAMGNPLAYADVSSSGEAQGAASASTSSDETPTTSDEADISQAWSAGEAVINKAGTYYLSEDVHAASALIVSVPAGQKAVIDFRGHTATVQGAVTEGIDASSSRGEVVVTDSTYQPSGESASAAVATRLVVEANKAADSVAALRVTPQVDSQKDAQGAVSYEANAPSVSASNIGVAVRLNTIDASATDIRHDAYGVYSDFVAASEAEQAAAKGAAVDVTLDNVAVEATVNNISLTADQAKDLSNQHGESTIGADQTGSAVAVCAGKPGVTLSGSFSTQLNSAYATSDLYAANDNSFMLAKDFSVSESVSIWSNGNAEGAAIATAAAGASSAEELAGSFALSQADDSLSVACSDDKLVVSRVASDAAAAVTFADEAAQTPIETASEEPPASNDRVIQGANVEGALCVNVNEKWETPTKQFIVGTSTTSTVQVPTGTKKLVLYLTGDMTVKNNILISVADLDVELYLNGYTLEGQINGAKPTAGGVANITAVSSLVSTSVNLNSLTINGVDGSGKYQGTLKRTSQENCSTTASTGASSVVFIGSSTLPKLTVENVSLVNKPEKASCAVGAGVIVKNANVTGATINNVDIDVDYTANDVNLGTSTYGSAFDNTVAGIYSASSDIAITNSTVNVKQRATGEGSKAVGVQFAGTGTANGSIDNCAVSASAPNGSATAIVSAGKTNIGSADAATKPSLQLSAIGMSAVGVQNSATKSIPVMLAGGISFNGTATGTGEKAIALSSSVSNNFSIDSSLHAYGIDEQGVAVASTLPVAIGTEGDINAADMIIGAWTETPSADEMARLAGMFADTVDGTPCTIVADESSVHFAMDQSTTAAYVQIAYPGQEGAVKYSTFNSALRALAASGKADGATIQLIGAPSTGGLTFDYLGSLDANTSITLDLNGHDIDYLYLPKTTTNTSTSKGYQGTLKVVDNSTGVKGAINGSMPDPSNTAYAETVYVVDYAKVEVDGVDIVPGFDAYAGRIPGNGVVYLAATPSTTATSSLTLRDMTLSASPTAAGSGTSYLVKTSNGTVTADNATLSLNRNAGGSAYGLYGVKYLTMSDSDVSVYGAASLIACAASVNGSGSIKIEDTKLSAVTDFATGIAYGVYSGSQAAPIELSNCSLNTVGASSTTAAVYSTSVSMALTLSGALTLTGNSAMNLASVISVNAGFTLTPSSEKIAVRNANLLANDVFAQSAVPGMSIEQLKSSFVADDSSYYAGFDVMTKGASTEDLLDDDASKLVFYHSPVAKNVNTGKEYAKVSAAVSAVSAGDTVQLIDDVVEYPTSAATAVTTSPLAPSKTMTLDLAGHTYDLDLARVTGTSARYAVFLNATNMQFAVTDSGADGAKGAFDIHMAKAVGDMAGNKIAFNNVKSGSSIVLDGVDVNIDYVTSSAARSATATTGANIYGVYLSGTNAAFKMVNGAYLSVAAAATDGKAYPISSVLGVNAATGSVVDTSSDSVIDVANNVPAAWKGVTIADSSAGMNINNPYLMEVSYEKGSAQYEAIQQAFAQQAKLDEAAMRYYAKPLKLDDGTLVWAFSDKIESGKLYSPESIVATNFWIQSDYQELSQVKGIEIGAATANLSGTLNVSGDESHGTGVSNISSAVSPSITFDDFELNVFAGGKLYRSTAAQTNWEDMYGLTPTTSSSSEGLFTPIVNTYPASYGTFITSKGSLSADDDSKKPVLTLDGKVTINTSGTNAVDIATHSFIAVGDSFVNGNGSAYTVTDPVGTATTASFTPGATNDKAGNIEGAAFARAAEGASIDASTAANFADAGGNLQAVVNDKGNLAWSKNLVSVSFNSEGKTMDGYDFPNVAYGTVISLPSAAEMHHTDAPSNTYTYEFVGWSKDPNTTADSFSAENGDIPASVGTLVATESAVYYAVYSEVAVEQTVTFTDMRNADGSLAADVAVKASYGQKLGDALAAAGQASVITSQNDYTDATGTYRFVGWRVDTEAVVWSPSYDMGSNITMTKDLMKGTLGLKIHAVYLLVGDNEHVVSFRSDGLVFAYVAENGSAPSLTAFTSADKSTVPSNYTLQKDTLIRTRYRTFADINKDYDLKGFKNGASSNSDYASEADIDYAVDAALPTSKTDQSFTLKFSSKAKMGTVKVNTRKKNVNAETGETVYSMTETVLANIEYGTDPIEAANEVVDPTSYLTTENGQTMVHEFLGWSTRQNDEKPIAGWEKDGSLPLMSETGLNQSSIGSSANYVIYAIYSERALTANVNFNADLGSGVERYASTSEAVEGQISLSDAFATVGKEAPSCEGYNFVGWALTADATGVGVTTVNDAVKLLDSTEEGISDYANITVDVYAVFEVKGTHLVTFFNDPDNAQDTYGVSLTEGDNVAGSGKQPVNPSRAGSYFAGWVTRAANDEGETVDTPFDMNAAIESDTSVYATFKPIEFEAAVSAAGASVDVAGAYLNSDAYKDAASVVVKVSSLSRTDSYLAAAAATPQNKNMRVADYLVQVIAHFADSDDVMIGDGFGTLAVTVPVDAQYAENTFTAYKLTDFDEAVYTDELGMSENGTITFPVTRIAVTDKVNNVCIAAIRTAAQIELYNYKSTAATELSSKFDSYREADYSAENYALLERIYAAGLENIQAAETTDAVQKAYSNAVGSLEDVATLGNASEIEYEKASDLSSLAAYYTQLAQARNSFSSEGWSAIEAEYSNGRAEISAAKSVDEAAQAYNDTLAHLQTLVSQYNGTGSTGATTGGSTGDTTTSGGASGLTGAAGTTSTTAAKITGVTGGLTSAFGTTGATTGASGLTGATSGASTALAAADGTDAAVAAQADTPDLDSMSFEEVVEYAKGLNESDYTEDSWKSLSDALDAAEKQLDKSATGDDADAVRSALVDAIKGLVKKPSTDASGLTAQVSANSGDDSAGQDSSNGVALEGAAAWIGSHWVLFVILPIILLLAVIGMAAYLLATRRKANPSSDLDLPDGTNPGITV